MKDLQINIAVIGAGNMGGALLSGLVKNTSPDSVWAVDPDANKLSELQKNLKIKTTTHPSEALPIAQVIVLAVKPQIMETVVNEILPHLNISQPPLIISIAAGIKISVLERLFLDPSIPIIRAMPNIAALIGNSATALSPNRQVTNPHRELAEAVMGAVGTIIWLDNEQLMDAVTALSGSGPAYFFVFMQALQNAGIALGLTVEDARLLTIATGLGAAKIAAESKLTLEELVQSVTSPGGTTEKALEVLTKDHRIYFLMLQALQAAKERSEELSGE